MITDNANRQNTCDISCMKIYTVLFALIFTFMSCKMEKGPGLSLITKTELLNFPSASSIEFHNGKLYVIGDDARNLAILDKNYKLVDTIELFPGEGLRIPKKIKADLEASTIVCHQVQLQPTSFF